MENNLPKVEGMYGEMYPALKKNKVEIRVRRLGACSKLWDLGLKPYKKENHESFYLCDTELAPQIPPLIGANKYLKDLWKLIGFVEQNKLVA